MAADWDRCRRMASGPGCSQRCMAVKQATPEGQNVPFLPFSMAAQTVRNG